MRAIDWKVTARIGAPHVKLFREERELTVHLLVDLSASLSFGTQTQTKRELVSELGALLAFAAIRNNDKVGLTLFTDQIETYVPPKKGRRHGLRVIRELINCEPQSQQTRIDLGLEHLGKIARRRAVVFLISDFLDSGIEQTLRIARRRHDVIPIIIRDLREDELPNMGWVEFQDLERGHVISVDTSSRRVRHAFASRIHHFDQQRENMFRRMRLDWITLNTGADIVEPLRAFFAARNLRS